MEDGVGKKGSWKNNFDQGLMPSPQNKSCPRFCEGDMEWIRCMGQVQPVDRPVKKEKFCFEGGGCHGIPALHRDIQQTPKNENNIIQNIGPHEEGQKQIK